jgi:RNA-directed DNA polymerase
MNILNHNELCSWNSISWKSIEIRVQKWQRKIYAASKNGNVKLVRKYQHLLLNSTDAKLLAVRRVTQDNQGKKTAGIDGISKLDPKQRWDMVKKLRFPTKASPLRRVWIPKPGRTEKRPLGIPTIQDRCLQALLKLAIEPEWEAKFEPNSYGFRPGKSAHDAICAIQSCIQKGDKYVIEADIARCFDTINHEALLNKIGLKGKYRTQLLYWLKAGVLDANIFQPTELGTPQGGIISPLLANIALHGIETHLKQSIREFAIYSRNGIKLRPAKNADTLHLIRYADDFVVLHKDRKVILHCLEEIKKFLSEMGLELSSDKTRLTHTLEITNEDIKLGFDPRIGFDFLGFTVKQFQTKHRSAYYSDRLGFKTLIFPSAKSMRKHQDNLRLIFRTKGGNLSQKDLIAVLNPVIRGWASYFGISNASSTKHLAKLDWLLYLKLRRWAKRSTKTMGVATKYWYKSGDRKWIFGIKNDTSLILYSDYSRPLNSPEGYIKVISAYSPFDENHDYWIKRTYTDPKNTNRVNSLLKKQKGRCKWCNLPFTEGSLKEVDHIIPRSQGGKDIPSNLQILHRHCHDQKTAEDNLKYS